MLRYLLILAAIVILAMALAPRVVPVLTWILAFLSLLILADFVISRLARLRRGARG